MYNSFFKTNDMQKQSVIILGHGSKSKDAIEDFNYVVEITKNKSDHHNVFGAHMEMAKPSLEDIVETIYQQGGVEIIIIPYFLFNGNHIKQDIPAKIDVLKVKYPQLKIRFGTPIGKEPLMAELILKKVKELSV